MMSVKMICFCFLASLHLVMPAQIRAACAQMWATTSAALSRSRGKRGEGMSYLTCPAKDDFAWLGKGFFDQDGGEGPRTFNEDGKVDARMQQPSA